jgi:hypothetical protein
MVVLKVSAVLLSSVILDEVGRPRACGCVAVSGTGRGTESARDSGAKWVSSRSAAPHRDHAAEPPRSSCATTRTSG